MALWKARSLSPEQKVRIVEEESETKSIQTEDSGSFLGLDDVSMSEVYSSALSVPVSCLSSLFVVMHFFYQVPQMNRIQKLQLLQRLFSYNQE